MPNSPSPNAIETMIDEVKKGLKDYRGPEPIAGRLKREGKESISHETIYPMNYPDYQRDGGTLDYLRR